MVEENGMEEAWQEEKGEDEEALPVEVVLLLLVMEGTTERVVGIDRIDLFYGGPMNDLFFSLRLFELTLLMSMEWIKNKSRAKP